MDLTTLARVRELMKKQTADTSDDVFIDRLIDKYAQAFEVYLGRHVQTTARTEVYRLPLLHAHLALRGYPVTTFISLMWSDTRDFSSAPALELDDEFVLDPDLGEIDILFTPNLPYVYYQAQYTAGMAVDTTAFIAAFPDITEACDLQVAYHLRRKMSPEGNLSVGTASQQYNEPLKLLTEVREAMDRHRRVLV